jgi:hypothetical protein
MLECYKINSKKKLKLCIFFVIKIDVYVNSKKPEEKLKPFFGEGSFSVDGFAPTKQRLVLSFHISGIFVFRKSIV